VKKIKGKLEEQWGKGEKVKKKVYA